MSERLYVPGKYIRSQRESAEEMRRGDVPPKVSFFDLTDNSSGRELAKAVKIAQGKKIILPWSSFTERVQGRATNKGLFKDELELYSRDTLALDQFAGNEEQISNELQKRDNPQNYLIAHFPWRRDNSFVKIPRHDEFKRIAQSRETGITSDEVQERIGDENFLILGGGVGGWIGLSLARAGAENIVLVDGSPIKPHRGSRIQGQFIPNMGENQATYHAKQMLEINPYGNYDAVPKFAGDPMQNPEAVSVRELVKNSSFVFQEIDNLALKDEIHNVALQLGIPVAQITDAGAGTIILLDHPNSKMDPFNGRLTPEVSREMQQMDPNDKDTFLAKAVEVYMGTENISPSFADALRISRERGFTHIPQSGRAASKAGSEAVQLYTDYIEGKSTSTYEKLVE